LFRRPRDMAESGWGCSCGARHGAPIFLCGQLFIDKSGEEMFVDGK
jgi:hypothetical protein